MKPARATSLVFATVAFATASLLVASPASAATTVGAGTFYDGTDFGVESAGYPTGVDWFFGDATGVDGPHAFTQVGLELNGDASGEVQILNQNVGVQPTSAADLIAMVEAFNINSADDTKWALQLPFFGEGATSGQFTTLYPDFLGNIPGPADTSVWFTTGTLGPYGAGTSATLQQLADELFVGEDPTLLAYGAFVVAANTALILDVEWGGDQSFFLPAPTRTISTSSISVTDASTTGFSVAGTNWLPGSEIYIEIQDPTGVEVFFTDSGTVDGTGSFTVSVVLPASAPLGTYTVHYFDDDFYMYEAGVFTEDFLTFEVTAAVLAVTGVSESGPYFAGAAGILALLGLTAVVVSRRRMKKI